MKIRRPGPTDPPTGARQARSRQGRAAEGTVWFASGQCSLGAFLVARSAAGVCAIVLGEDSGLLVHDLRKRFRGRAVTDAGMEQGLPVAETARLIDNPGRPCPFRLDMGGTPFQQQVWAALLAIPPGETASYAEIAAQIGHPEAVRAVASACSANRIAVAIPCHRAVRKDGRPSGYRWGAWRKQELLRREQANRR